MSDRTQRGPTPVELHPTLSPDVADAAREAWQRPNRVSQQHGPELSADEARVLYAIRAADAAAQLRAKGLIPHESLEGWALDRVQTSSGTMTRLKAFLEVDTAEEICNATYDQLVAEEASADPALG